MDMPFPEKGAHPMFLAPMKTLLRRHPRTKIIWSHIGLGRIIRPARDHLRIIEGILKDPAFDHVYFDISWDEVAKYLETTSTTAERSAGVIRRYPDRFLFGTDLIGPTDRGKYLAVYEQYGPLWVLLDRATSEQVRKGNHQRLFDEARRKVRAWERARGLAPRPRR
jgi:predicted TIM-barrel fold metal-dependent hydrolase